MFDNTTDDDAADSDDGGNQFNVNISDSFVKGVVYVIIGIIAGIIVVLLGIRAIAGIALMIRFLKSGLNDRLIIRYSSYYKRRSRFNKEFKNKINYLEQIQYIYNVKKEKLARKNEEKAMEFEKQFDIERIIDILNRAGFSDKEILQEEYDYVSKILF